MLERHVIVAVHITDRVSHAGQVQKMFTDFGCNIRTRIGLHDVDGKYCSPNGLIVLEFVGDDSALSEFTSGVGAVEGVEVKSMTFDHP